MQQKLLKDLHQMAEQLNGMGRFDAVIHNVGVGYREPRRIMKTAFRMCSPSMSWLLMF
jgi:hypothetical protein